MIVGLLHFGNPFLTHKVMLPAYWEMRMFDVHLNAKQDHLLVAGVSRSDR